MMAFPRATKPVEYDFIEEPSKDFFCPVTFDLLREPHQTLCCGNHLSQEAVTRLKEKPCPMCKKPNFGTVPDKFFMRRVNELKLYCPNKSLGCEWVGELGSLDQHLMEGRCRYAEMACEFSHAGCRAKLPHQLLQAHLSENVKGHLSMVAEHLQQQNNQQQQQIAKLQNTVTEQQRQIGQQQQQIERLISALSRVHMTVCDIVMTDFEEHKKASNIWYSPPFYTHIGGYKMCLVVYANGYDDGKGTHVSVFCSLMRGEYDDQLKWPFCGDIIIQLLNQRRDEGHWEGTSDFYDGVGDQYAGRVVGRERARHCWGFSKFILHNKLSTEDKEYLKNDCLKFRILKVVVKSF